jgi:hypothetical protein
LASRGTSLLLDEAGGYTIDQVATPDGNNKWTMTSDRFGDPTDVSPTVTILVIWADGVCSEALDLVRSKDPDDYTPTLPPSCKPMRTVTVPVHGWD